MGVLGLADSVGLGRARSQPERLLVLRIYLLWRSVYIFMLDVKVQRLSPQASVGAPVNGARDRCASAASSGSIRRESGLPCLAQLHLAVPGALWSPPRRSCEEGWLCPALLYLLHPMKSRKMPVKRAMQQMLRVPCQPTCGTGPLSRATPALL